MHAYYLHAIVCSCSPSTLSVQSITCEIKPLHQPTHSPHPHSHIPTIVPPSLTSTHSSQLHTTHTLTPHSSQLHTPHTTLLTFSHPHTYRDGSSVYQLNFLGMDGHHWHSWSELSSLQNLHLQGDEKIVNFCRHPSVSL